MAYYALFYDLVDDYIQRRTQYREEHLRLAKDSQNRGEMVLAGAFAEPADQALLLFKSDTSSVVEQFVKNDPYVRNGLVKKWTIRIWTVVIGNT